MLLYAVGCLLIAGTGCESLQKKFVRKTPPKPRPSPVVQFEDYSKGVTPLDRYRKHYLLFEYWNAELLREFEQATTSGGPAGKASLNLKRARQASEETLKELRTLQRVLQPEAADGLEPIIAVRQTLDRQLLQGASGASQLGEWWRTLEAQSRQIHREFFWRDVESKLQADGEPTEPSD